MNWETIKGYWRALGLFNRATHIYRPFGSLLEIDRCESDGRLVTNSQAALAKHGGHKMKGPVRITPLELLLIWARVIR